MITKYNNYTIYNSSNYPNEIVLYHDIGFDAIPIFYFTLSLIYGNVYIQSDGDESIEHCKILKAYHDYNDYKKPGELLNYLEEILNNYKEAIMSDSYEKFKIECINDPVVKRDYPELHQIINIEIKKKDFNI